MKDEKVWLRPLESDDLDTLYTWENDPEMWGVSNTLMPFSRNILAKFIANQALDIYETKQTRFLIESSETGKPIGTIDLFDFDPFHRRAGVGIMIYDKHDRGKGHAKAALKLLANYAFRTLELHQLYANIAEDNIHSLKLFESSGFEVCGVKKEWLRSGGKWKSEITLQLLNR